LKLEFSASISRLGEDLKTMKASKFTEAQKAFILKQGKERAAVAEICRKAGISQATWFNWSAADKQTIRGTVCPPDTVWRFHVTAPSQIHGLLARARTCSRPWNGSVGKSARHPDLVIDPQPDEPSKQQVILHLHHQLPLGPNRAEDPEQAGPDQPLRRDHRTRAWSQGGARRFGLSSAL